MAGCIWITGLPGAGKSTVARALIATMREQSLAPVHLDGDALRDVFQDYGYTQDDRFRLSLAYGRLCALLVNQGCLVVCSTVAMFEDVWRTNRETIPNYIEVYLKVGMNVLESRDQKQLYSRAKRGEVKNVPGVDVPLCEPSSPDVVIKNEGEQSAEQVAKNLFERVRASIGV